MIVYCDMETCMNQIDGVCRKEKLQIEQIVDDAVCADYEEWEDE